MPTKRPPGPTPTTPTSSGSNHPSFPPPSAYRLDSGSGSYTTDNLSAPPRTLLRNRLSTNFEDLLKENSTVQLKAGTLDESKLGVVFTPPISRTATSLTTPGSEISSPSMGRSKMLPQIQPATPTVVPPTPLAGNSPADPAQLNNTFNVTIDEGSPGPVDNSTKRRSLLRSAGTASSPDLATLVRKARERGGVIDNAKANTQNQLSVDSKHAGPSSSGTHASRDFLTPIANSSRTRATSSTSSFSIIVQPDMAPSTPVGQQTIRPSSSSKKLTKQPSPVYTPVAHELVSSPSRSASHSTSSGKETNKVCEAALQ